VSLSREEILRARTNRKPVPIEVPEWGGVVFAKVLSANDQSTLVEDGVPDGALPVRVLVRALCDENENPLFSEDDAAELGKEAFPVILRVFSVVAKLNGLSNKELEEAVATFGPPQAAGSSIG
jgi:hypothetical protein